MKAKQQSIQQFTSAVFDNGRRGNPKPGCDCVQCFGYCLVDRDKMARDLAVSRAPSDTTLDIPETAR